MNSASKREYLLEVILYTYLKRKSRQQPWFNKGPAPISSHALLCQCGKLFPTVFPPFLTTIPKYLYLGDVLPAKPLLETPLPPSILALRILHIQFPLVKPRPWVDDGQDPLSGTDDGDFAIGP